MWDLKACVVCLSTLSTGHKLYHLDESGLREDFNAVAGLNSYKGNGLPPYVCVECAAYVRRYKYFQGKCQRANFLLHEILKQNKVVKESVLNSLNKESLNIMPSITFWNLNKCHYEKHKFQWIKHNRISLVEASNAPIFYMSTIDNMDCQPRKDLKEEEVIIKNEDYVEVEIPSISSEGTKSELPVQIKEINGTVVETEVSDFNDITNYDSNSDDNTADNSVVLDNDVDGSKLDEEYATIIALTDNEQKATSEVYKLLSHGKHKCEVCQKGYQSEQRLKIHMRMHDKHVSGYFLCELCSFYYKTEFLLKTHITEKHMYKYLCPLCPEVNFDRPSAKQHYIWGHLQKGKGPGSWYDTKPTWLSTRGGKRIKADKADKDDIISQKEERKRRRKKPKDFPIYTPIGHLEQYEIINQRQFTKNFTESIYKCGSCFRGFRENGTYTNHLKKHNPKLSGKYKCDICSLYFINTRKLYKHMIITHLYKYSCQTCDYVCYNLGQARSHYKWHKNVTYNCPHCEKVFTKQSTRLTHIRIKHPSTEICTICGHSYVSVAGVYFHKKKSHTKEEIELSLKMLDNPEEGDQNLYCAECHTQFLNQKAFEVHFGSSSKHATENISVKPKSIAEQARMRKKQRTDKRHRRTNEVHNNGLTTSTICEECGIILPNDVQARKHYKNDHPGAEFLKRYMCDMCGHTTQQYSNLLVHMRTHTREKPYACNYCDRRFSMPSNRDRHHVVHTGEKRFECEHCHRKFTQSSAVKLHIQTVHFKIPYAPWNKANRKRSTKPKDVVGQTDPKIVAETQGEYLHAYISYHDEGV